MTRTLRISILLAIVAALITAGLASAHADFARSDPAPNSMLSAAPAQVRLWFTEPIEPGFSSITVLFEDGATVDAADSLVSPADPTQLTVSLAEQREGTYIVAWRVLSAVDGHLTSGSFVFAAGKPLNRSGINRPAGGAVTSPLDMLARALNFIGQAALFGVIVFRWLVWRPALKSAELGAEVDARAVALGKRVIVIGLGLAVAGTVLSLIAQTSATGASIGAWLGTRVGRIWIGRAATLIALAVLADEIASAGRRTKWPAILPDIAVGWLGLQLLLTTSLTSHSAAITAPPLIPLVADWLHLTATAIWVGGLAQMAFVVPSIARALDDDDRAWLWLKTVVHFSTIAALGLGVLLVTGVYLSTLHVGDWPSLIGTIYGRALLFKLTLAGIAMLLGAFNLFVVKPRLDRAVDAPEAESSRALQRRFRRVVTFEAIAALAVLASAGILTDLPRSKDPQPVAAGGSLQLSTRAEDLAVTLAIDPALEGPNTFDVRLEQNGALISDAREVSLRFTYLTRSLGSTNAAATPAAEGTYTADGAYLALPGDWQIEVAVRRPDAFDAFAAYRVKVGLDGRIEPTGGATLTESIARWLSIYGLAFGGALAIAMGVLWLIIGAKAARGLVSQAVLALPALIALPIGALSVITFYREATPGLALTNPYLPDEQSLAAGQLLFAANCAACHGEAGRGDGPAGEDLNPRPADFGNGHLDIHTDGDIFYWIQNGPPTVNSPMPAFKDKLSEEETWHLVNYVRRLRNRAGEVASNAPHPVETPSAPLQPFTPPSFIAPGGSIDSTATLSSSTPATSSDPEALALLERADAAMNALNSLEEKQTLRDDAGNQLSVIFTYAAPDRMRYQIVNGATAIQIGLDDYQLGPDGNWIKNQRAISFKWPEFYYANYGRIAGDARIAGEEPVGDRAASVVAFKYSAYDFWLWIDVESNRILKFTMDGANHHMVSSYQNFDSADLIEPPAP
ncbi:MAG TPA: copper resistance protein CopC [Anaerolineae bacterium]|nr:copper resistance protein CopC [Anaerolineae bacterium]